jgi:hypothetical protein
MFTSPQPDAHYYCGVCESTILGVVRVSARDRVTKGYPHPFSRTPFSCAGSRKRAMWPPLSLQCCRNRALGQMRPLTLTWRCSLPWRRH